MALFRCGKCGCEEDTALCHYWSAKIQEAPLLCSACDPKIGKWNGAFPRKYEGSPASPQPTDAARSMVGWTRLLDAALVWLKQTRRLLTRCETKQVPPRWGCWRGMRTNGAAGVNGAGLCVDR
jgi:hypothetical protein